MQSAGELVAQAKGYYKAAGITITLDPGGPSANPISLVAGGSIPVGITYQAPVILARSQGIPIKAFAATYQKAPLAYFAFKSSGITSIADFRGKTIGIQPGGAVFLEALLKANNLQLQDVKTVNVGSGTEALANGRVDVIAAWIIDIPQLAPILQHPGLEHWLLYDHGMKQQANVYIATDATIKKEKNLLAELLNVASQGYAYAFDHPDEAAAIVVHQASGLNTSSQAAELKAMEPLIFDSLTKTQGWGAIDTAVWADAIAMYAGLGRLKTSVTAADVVTTEILGLATERVKR
ncbi:MAG: ABC transporter substrate-binding protein [Actinomycetes bacterium]